MNNDKLKNIEFYKDLYLFEHERGKFYDTVIQYPTTLLVVFIGGVFYSFKNYFKIGNICICTPKDWIFITLLGLFLLSTIVTIYFLSTVFHGFTRRYNYLPFTGELLNHEKELYKFHYKYSEGTSIKEKRDDAHKNTCDGFSNNLKNYYVELTEINQKINDKRADNYYLTRTFLFIDLLLLLCIGLIGILN